MTGHISPAQAQALVRLGYGGVFPQMVWWRSYDRREDRDYWTLEYRGDDGPGTVMPRWVAAPTILEALLWLETERGAVWGSIVEDGREWVLYTEETVVAERYATAAALLDAILDKEEATHE